MNIQVKCTLPHISNADGLDRISWFVVITSRVSYC